MVTLDHSLERKELAPAIARGEIKLVSAMTEEKVFRIGAQLFAAGAGYDFIWRVRTGWVCRSRFLPNGKRQIVILYLPGDLIAVKSMMMQMQIDAMECLTQATVAGISQRELHRLASQDYDIALRLMWQLSEEERRLHKWVVGLGVCNAEERMAAMLLDFHTRLGPLGLVRDNSYNLPLTQQQMGDHLGLTFVHVNRVLQRFRTMEIALVKGGRASLLDLNRLQQLSRPMRDVFERNSDISVSELAS